jgi:hypothetical protein
VTASQLGLNHKQVAAELGLTHQTVRAKDSEARALIFSLVACARGRDIREATDVNLFGYLEGQKLSRADRRLAQHHLKHCASCQQIAALGGEVDAVASRLALPLPLLFGGPGVVSHLVGAKLKALASTGARGSSGTVTARAGSGAIGGAYSVGAGKLATALGVVALAGAGTTAAVAHHDTKLRSGTGVASAPQTNGPVEAHVRKVLPAATFAPPRSAKRQRHRRRHHPRHRLIHRAPASAPPLAASPPPSTATASTPPAATTSSAPPERSRLPAAEASSYSGAGSR